jgi:hypothetical protein
MTEQPTAEKFCPCGKLIQHPDEHPGECCDCFDARMEDPYIYPTKHWMDWRLRHGRNERTDDT